VGGLLLTLTSLAAAATPVMSGNPLFAGWYAVYHRRPLNETAANHRVTCIDRMEFDERGFIKPIRITRAGVERRALSSSGTFTNPLNPGPDPWMRYHEGHYYLTTTQGRSIRMWKAPTLEALKTAAPITVWTDEHPERSHGIWAPEFHFIAGRWYLYYTAMAATGVDTTHRMHVLESAGTDPLGPYGYKGRLFDPANDFYAIDGSVFRHPGDGHWYFLWAAHPGHRIRIARMANPWTLTGRSVEIPASGFGCEEVREGPVVLHRNGRLFLTYSACDTGKPDYKIGMLVADENADVMDPAVWRQHPGPVFERNDAAGVFGPGHHGFFRSPDGSEDWIVYHGKTTSEYTYRGRSTRAQRFDWNADGTPRFGKPVSLDTALPEPSRRQDARSFTNPVAPTGADPWVIQRDGAYFLCQSRRGGIWVHRVARLRDIGRSPGRCVWTAPPDGPYSKELWAPELHYLRGRWYIYVAADDGDNHNHRMVVLEGQSDDPQEPFTFKGKIASPDDRWAIDGTVLQMPDDHLYFIWSGWEGSVNVAQHLYIAPMSDPWTISGERVQISSPEHAWECNGKPLINEGPQVLWNGPHLFIIYSASGSWTDDYCLGQLRWTGGDPLERGSWIKNSSAVFTRTEDVFGPGHCCFVKSRDRSENWIVYHSAKHSGAGWNRRINMQRFTWHPDGAPNFGRPIAAGVSMREPSGE
jgi:GH43 family beta-xylosidase